MIPLYFLLCVYVCVCVCVLSHVQLFVTPWPIACLASLSVEFPRQEYWSGLPYPTPADALKGLKVSRISLDFGLPISFCFAFLSKGGSKAKCTVGN